MEGGCLQWCEVDQSIVWSDCVWEQLQMGPVGITTCNAGSVTMAPVASVALLLVLIHGLL